MEHDWKDWLEEMPQLSLMTLRQFLAYLDDHSASDNNPLFLRTYQDLRSQYSFAFTDGDRDEFTLYHLAHRKTGPLALTDMQVQVLRRMIAVYMLLQSRRTVATSQE